MQWFFLEQLLGKKETYWYSYTYIKGRWFILYMYVLIHVASEPVCPTQGHMRSRTHRHGTELDTWGGAVSMQSRELLPRDPAIPHIFTPGFSYDQIFPHHHYVQLHLLGVTVTGWKPPKGWRGSPNLKRNKITFARKRSPAQKLWFQIMRSPGLPSRLWGSGKWWWWFISCSSSP